jgi:hypothetical protein
MFKDLSELYLFLTLKVLRRPLRLCSKGQGRYLKFGKRP